MTQGRRGSRPDGQDDSDQPAEAQDRPGEFRSSDVVRTALIEGNTFRGRAIQYAVVDGLAIFEGDIILGTEEQVAQRTEQLRAELTGQVAAGVVISGAQFRWPNCTIPYTIDPALPTQNRVTDAIVHWQDRTRVRFVVRTTEADYVTFRPAGGCSSSVGRQGGQQFINLGPGCTTGNTIHEIGHTVGLWHEQSRADRDAFITIRWDKIQAGYEHNFNQHIADGDDVGAYDYGSIMHYPRSAFSVDGSDTITPIDPTAQIGQRLALSVGDVAASNSLCPIVKGKELVKDVRFDTRKELVKDVRFDTRKELIADTRKELILDTRKEVALDPPWGKPSLDPRGPGLPPGVLPGQPLLPGSRPGGLLPFTVAAAHQAPVAEAEPAQLEDAIGILDAQLQMLADQLAQAEATTQALQAQYDETAALLQQTLEAHDQATAP